MLKNKPVTQLEKEGLLKHAFPVRQPSQLSDAFRLGVAHAVDKIVGTDVGVMMQEHSEMKELLSRIRSDLLTRGEKDSEGVIVVDLSDSLWIKLNKVLEP